MTRPKDAAALGSQLVDRLTVLGVDYMNFVLGGINKPTGRQLKLYMQLRDSAIYRAQTSIYHLDLLSQVDEAVRARARSTMDKKVHESLMFSAADQEMFLLDDIVNHLASLFEHIGNLVGFVFYGEQRARIKWKGVVGYCRSEKREKEKNGKTYIHDSDVAPTLLHKEDTLVRYLQDYRAELFHHRRDGPNSTLSYSIKDDRFDVGLDVSVPPRMTMFFQRIAGFGEDETTLLEAASRLTGLSVLAASNVVDVLWASIRSHPRVFIKSGRIPRRRDA